MPLTEEAGAPRRTYGVKEQHRNSWGWKVSAYLWTKSIAAGAFSVPALLAFADPAVHVLRPGAAVIALLFLAATGLLLVLDLRQPGRFLWTLTHPQWRSWVVRGAYILTAYGLLLALHVALGLWSGAPSTFLTATTLIAAALTAIYTAFLFGQAKGRDLWQSPLLGPHLAVQALVAGACLFEASLLRWLLPLNGLLVAGEVFGRHATEDARRAAHAIQADARFTTGVLALGHLLPLALLWGAPVAAENAARSLTLAGLLVWEHLYVQAPQQIPNA
jgi:formate-dependent nitrite reductase membrane component NrfD